MAKAPYEAHLFICTHQRDGKECCADKGSAALRDEAKRLAKERGWKGRVRVNASGCLDRCSEGIAAVMYPQAKWFTGLDASSAPKLIEAIAEALGETGRD